MKEKNRLRLAYAVLGVLIISIIGLSYVYVAGGDSPDNPTNVNQDNSNSDITPDSPNDIDQDNSNEETPTDSSTNIDQDDLNTDIDSDETVRTINPNIAIITVNVTDTVQRLEEPGFEPQFYSDTRISNAKQNPTGEEFVEMPVFEAVDSYLVTVTSYGDPFYMYQVNENGEIIAKVPYEEVQNYYNNADS